MMRCSLCPSNWTWELAPAVCQCGGLLSWEPAASLSSRASGRGPFAPRSIAIDPTPIGLREGALHRSGIWRFGELVWPGPRETIQTLEEGQTPLLPLHTRLATRYGVGASQVLLKHEGWNPSGSFKDRGISVAMTHAVWRGECVAVCASTGNTSSSLATYAGAAGLRAVVLVPRGQISGPKLAQTLAMGAWVIEIDGTFDDCMRITHALATTPVPGVGVMNSLNPWRIAGQRTIAWHLLEQLGWQAPEWIVVPGGNLGNSSAIGEALLMAYEWGWISSVPRLVVTQAAGAAPFHSWAKSHWTRWQPVESPQTIASAIRIGDPVSRFRAQDVVKRLDGFTLAIPDAELLAAKRDLDDTGVGCEPASATTWAGLQYVMKSPHWKSTDRAVAILTGHVLKDPRPGEVNVPAPQHVQNFTMSQDETSRLGSATPSEFLAWIRCIL